MIAAIGRSVAYAAIALALAPALSRAHLMPEGNGSSKVVDNKAYSLISVPVAVLSGFDDDGNELISTVEARRHAASLHRQLEKKVRLSDGHTYGRTLYQDLQVPHFDSASAITSRSIILIRVSEWDSVPKRLRVEADVFSKELSELSFRAILGDSTEIAILTKANAAHTFFGPQPGRGLTALLIPGAVLASLLVLFGLIWSRTAHGRYPVTSSPNT